MSLLALSAPTQLISDPQLNSGVNITSLGSGASALTGNTGFTIVWVANVGFALVIGATAPGATALVNPGNNPAYTSNLSLGVSSATSATYFVGPIGQEWVNSSGLIQVNVTTVTTVSVYAYIVPGTLYSSYGTGWKHNPFELNPQNADY